MFEPQFVHPRWIVAQLAKWSVPMRTVAELMRFSHSDMSLWANSKRRLSVADQITVLYIMEFIREIRNEYDDVPINFSDAVTLRPRWEEFQRRRTATDTVQHSDEQQRVTA